MEVFKGIKPSPIVIQPTLLVKFKSLKVLELDMASRVSEVESLIRVLDEMRKQFAANN